MRNATCSELECDRTARARGLCEKHYDWHRRHGLLVNVVRPSREEYASTTSSASARCTTSGHARERKAERG